MYKICVFDMDGTTVNTLKTISYYANKVIAKYGIEPYSEEDFRDFVGAGALNMVKNMQKAKYFDPDLIEAITNDWIKEYENGPAYLSEEYPGISGLFKTLRANGIHTAILTNKHETMALDVVKYLFPGDIVEHLSGEKPGVKLKPDPSSLLTILEKFDCKPEECLYIGDTSIDMKTGKGVGAYTIGVSWGFRSVDSLIESGADIIVDRAEEIAAIALK